MTSNEVMHSSNSNFFRDVILHGVDYDRLYVEFCESLGLLPTPLLHLIESTELLTNGFFDLYYGELISFIDIIIAQKIEEEHQIDELTTEQIIDLDEEYREHYFMESEELFVEELFNFWVENGYVLSEYSSENKIINEPFKPVW